MAIQPIDLQTLYAQLEKVGKTQVHQQAAVQNAREAELARNREDAQKKVTTVQEAEAGEEGTGIVRERKDSSGDTANDARSGPEGRQQENTAPEESDDREVIRDPDLGSHIDISG